jgi:hypothetical protein
MADGARDHQRGSTDKEVHKGSASFNPTVWPHTREVVAGKLRRDIAS